MGKVTTPGFYGGRFHQGGQHTDASTEASGDHDLDGLSKAELVERAKAVGLDVADNATKADILAALKAR